MFFGPRITTVFTSRWKALSWSAGVLMTAYCSIPAHDREDATTATDPAVAAMLTPADQSSTGAVRHPVSPWAIASASAAR